MGKKVFTRIGKGLFTATKILAENELAAFHAMRQGKKVVQCHGVFDLIHTGHLAYFAEAAQLGDLLVVSVTSDSFVNKGPGRPVFGQKERMEMLAGLEIVDYVLLSDSESAVDVINLIRPDFYVKGPDYSNSEEDATGKILQEQRAVEAVGGSFRTTRTPTQSSSRVINAYGLAHSEEFAAWLDENRPAIDLAQVTQALAAIQQLRVLVVGEVISDEYARHTALGKTGKTNLLAYLDELDRTKFLGGAGAIARHIAGLGAQTTSLTKLGNDDEGTWQSAQLSAIPRVSNEAQLSSNFISINKTRYVDSDSGRIVFETYRMLDQNPPEVEDFDLAERFQHLAPHHDLALVCDFGHGVFGNQLVNAVNQSAIFKAVNVQSNAGNRGHISIEKFTNPDVLSMNGSELLLETRKRHATVFQLGPEVLQRTRATSLFVTAGDKGLTHFTGSSVSTYPALTNRVIDPVGAGDAVFAMLALLSKLGVDPKLSGFLANLAGAQMVGTVGNSTALNASDLIRAAEFTLK